jgi:D-hydroxyproline dehydrogenase subunit beta
MLPAVSNVGRSSAPDVVVVGGGIVGTSAAAFLAEAGLSVTLLERVGVAAGASGRNSGVVQHPFDPALRSIHLATVDAYRELAADPELDFRLPAEPAGLLLVSLGTAGPRRIAAELGAAWPDFEPEYLGPDDLHRLEPGLAPGLAACRLRIGLPVPPAAATRAFGRLAERRGARLQVTRSVTGLVRSGDRVTGVRLADGATIPAGAVLVAAGPWSPGLLDPGGRWRPIRPNWGVVVEVGLADPPGHVLEEAEMDEALGDIAGGSAAEGVETSGNVAGGDGAAGVDPIGPDGRPEFSLVTAAGRSSLGSTFLDREPDPDAWVPRLVAHGRRFVPALGEASIGPVRACARPLAADGRPLLGAAPGLPGAFIAAGHGPWGISTGPGSARLVVEAILGHGSAIPAELDVARFGAIG